MVEEAGSASLPPEVKQFIIGAEPRFKDEPEPDQFCGREARLSAMMRIITKTLENKTGIGTYAGQQLIAAPGVGKTSVIAELERRLKEAKISCIRARPEDILTPEAFNSRILDENPWRRVARLKELGGTIAEILKKPADQAANWTLKAALVHCGLPPTLAKIPVFETVVNKWLQEREPTTRDVLKLLQHGAKNGCVLIIDEAQDMNQYLEDKDCKVHMHLVIESLGIPNSRKSRNVGKSTIVLAGLSDTPCVVERIGSQGIEPTVLRPLPRHDVREMVRKSIELGAGGKRTVAEKAVSIWGDRITAEYGDWTRRAKAGALAVQDLLEEFNGRVIAEAWGDAAINRLGEKYKSDMYDSIRERSKDDGSDRGVGIATIDLVTYALLCNGNRIAQQTLRRLVNNSVATLEDPERFAGKANADKRATEAHRIVQRLLHTGLLDRTDHLPEAEDKRLQSYYSPIPSLLDYNESMITTPRERMDPLLEAEHLEHGQYTPRTERFQPTWREDEEPDEDNLG